MFTGKARIVALFALAALLVGGAIGVWSAASPRAAAADSKDSKVKALLKERHATLRDLVKVATTDYVGGKVSFERLVQAQQALLKAELELCESDKERIAILEKGVVLAKEYEKNADTRYRAGQTTHSDVLLAKANRLEAEIALERVKAK